MKDLMKGQDEKIKQWSVQWRDDDESNASHHFIILCFKSASDFQILKSGDDTVMTDKDYANNWSDNSNSSVAVNM